MNPNDTENIKLINHHRKTPTSTKKEQDKNEIANQITSNYQAGQQGKHSGHSLHCVNRNLAAGNLSSTYPVPNNQIQTANYLNQKDQQLAQPQQQAAHRPPFYQHHHHTHHQPTSQPHVHHYHPNTPESVYSQSLHYLHPHQFYYLHNQPKFFTGSPHQCQFTASVQPTPPQLTHSHSGTTNLNSLPPATACANLINADSANTTTSFQSNQISPTQQQQQQQQLQSIEPITNPNYINSTAQARSSSISNYSPQQPSNHYPGVNAATAYSNRAQFHHKQSAAGKPENKMNQQDYDWNKKVKKWQRFPGRNKFYCDGRLMIAKQAGVFYFTLSLLVAVCTAFFIIDCPYLALHVSKFIPVVGAILFVFSLSTLLRTSFSDPGGRLRQNSPH